MSSRAAQRVGAVLKGKWRLDALIGVGGMASVYSATHRNGSRVAIKMLSPEYAAQPEFVARFMREGYVANKINHPGSVLVLDDDTDDDGTAFLVMELLSGHSLERYARRGAPRLPLDHVLHIGERVLDLLAIAHGHGILHRDIKPANILVTAEGLVKVLDFGIARLAEHVGDASATQTGASLGTPSYMPPEQARGRWNMVDPRTDLWALGATMHALILGDRPRRAETVQEEMLLAMTAPLPTLRDTAPGTPPAVVALVDRATAFEMEARWPNALAMQQGLRDVMHGASLPLTPALLVQGPASPLVSGPREARPVRVRTRLASCRPRRRDRRGTRRRSTRPSTRGTRAPRSRSRHRRRGRAVIRIGAHARRRTPRARPCSHPTRPTAPTPAAAAAAIHARRAPSARHRRLPASQPRRPRPPRPVSPRRPPRLRPRPLDMDIAVPSPRRKRSDEARDTREATVPDEPKPAPSGTARPPPRQTRPDQLRLHLRRAILRPRMRTLTVPLTAISAVAMLTLAGGSASAAPTAAKPAADPAVTARATALFHEGRVAAEAGDNKTACERFGESEQLQPAPGDPAQPRCLRREAGPPARSARALPQGGRQLWPQRTEGAQSPRTPRLP